MRLRLRYILAAGLVAGTAATSYLDTASNEENVLAGHTEDLISRPLPLPPQASVSTISKTPEIPEQNRKAEQPEPQPYMKPAKGKTYEMGGKRFTVSAAVADSFTQVSKHFGIPYDAMIATCARESDCAPDSINAKSEACGLFQFMTNRVETLYEVLYKYGPQHGYQEEAKWVERYTRKKDSKGRPYFGYRPVSDEAKSKTVELCKDPQFNATMWAAYHSPQYDRYNKWLGNRTMTTGEVVAMNNLGLKGLKLFAKKAWDDAKTGNKTLAVDFFKQHRRIYGSGMAANKTLIRHPDGRYKTVRESYNDIFAFGGFRPVAEITTAALTQ